MCRDGEDAWIAVEIKRIATIDAVEQLTRYLQRIRLDPAMAACRGVLAAQSIKPQARVLAESRGLDCVEVDLAVLRGEREPDLTLFVADAPRRPLLDTRSRSEDPGLAPARKSRASRSTTPVAGLMLDPWAGLHRSSRSAAAGSRWTAIRCSTTSSSG